MEGSAPILVTDKLASLVSGPPNRRVVAYACRMQPTFDRDYFSVLCAGCDADYINSKFEKFLSALSIDNLATAEDGEVLYDFLVAHPEIRFMDMQACRLLLPDEVCRLPAIAA